MNLSQIKQLALLKQGNNLCISLFLNINAKKRRRSDIQTTLNHLIEEEEKNNKVDQKQKKLLKKDIEKIHDFIDLGLTQENNRGLVVYANSQTGLFKIIYLPQEVDDRIFYSQNLLIRPLIGYLDKYGKYLAVLVDQSRGRFFEIKDGAATDYSYFRDEVPNMVKEGGFNGYDERHIEKHVVEHLHRHYKKVADKTLEMINQFNYRWLILVGQQKSITHLKADLHPYAKQLIAAQIKENLIKNRTDAILKRVFAEVENIRNKEHLNLLNELNEKLPKKAVTGLDKVSAAINDKVARKFLLSTSFRQSYPLCEHCNYLLHEQLVCPKCSTDLSLIDYETNELTIKALRQNCETHFIENEAFNKQGGIGAILRF